MLFLTPKQLKVFLSFRKPRNFTNKLSQEEQAIIDLLEENNLIEPNRFQNNCDNSFEVLHVGYDWTISQHGKSYLFELTLYFVGVLCAILAVIAAFVAL